ncbi:MAG: DNA polymerase III subunit beta [Eubacteriales bacterium]|nr:DNA polymerase III subunit beta [Eubacteriales bacterium]
MKIKIKRQQLLNAINIAGRAVSVKTTMPILECLLITATEGGVKMMANDMELAIETTVPADSCVVMEPGVIAVDAKLFGDIVRKIALNEDSEILITSDGSLVEIKGEKSLFRIQEKDPDQFPELPMVNENKYINISEFTLKDIIKDTIFSIAANDSNKMMTGELFEVKDGMLKVVSLDGHRISVRNTALNGEYENFKAIIPGKTLNEISKILPGDAEKTVSIFFDENYASFKFGSTVMATRLIDGEYFKIDAMLSSDYETKIIVNKREFLDAIEQSTILIRETDKKPLVLKIAENSLNMKVNSLMGSLDAVIGIEKDGNDLMIAFNPKFLLDALRVIDEETVSLYMTNSKAPCFIKDDEGKFIYLILPVNFNPAAY